MPRSFQLRSDACHQQGHRQRLGKPCEATFSRLNRTVRRRGLCHRSFLTESQRLQRHEQLYTFFVRLVAWFTISGDWLVARRRNSLFSGRSANAADTWRLRSLLYRLSWSFKWRSPTGRLEAYRFFLRLLLLLLISSSVLIQSSHGSSEWPITEYHSFKTYGCFAVSTTICKVWFWAVTTLNLCSKNSCQIKGLGAWY